MCRNDAEPQVDRLGLVAHALPRCNEGTQGSPCAPTPSGNKPRYGSSCCRWRRPSSRQSSAGAGSRAGTWWPLGRKAAVRSPRRTTRLAAPPPSLLVQIALPLFSEVALASAFANAANSSSEALVDVPDPVPIDAGRVFVYRPMSTLLSRCAGRPLRCLILLHPGVEFKAIEGDALGRRSGSR